MKHEFSTDFYSSASSAIPSPDPQLIEFYTEIKKTCSQEWETMSLVFPNAQYVMQQFVQRIFAQSVQSQLESLFLQAEKAGPNIYLKVLASSHAATQQLVNHLSTLDEEVISVGVGAPVLTAILERSFADLFVPYTEGDRYMELETKLFRQVWDQKLFNFFTYIANRQRACTKRGFKTLVTTTAVSPTPAQEKTFTQSLFAATNDTAPISALGGDEMGVPTMDTMLAILKAHVESVFRCKQLVISSALYFLLNFQAFQSFNPF